MFNLVLVAVTLAPLLGVFLMELGAFGLDVGWGHPNGATVLYLIHFVVFWTVYATFLFLYRLRHAGPVPDRHAPDVVYTTPGFRRLAMLVLLFHFALVLFLLFAVGTVDVLFGGMNKGEFRARLGPLGTVAYLSRDFLIPLMAALVAFVYRRAPTRSLDTGLLTGVLLLTAFSGAMWGFKAAALVSLIAPLTILAPRIRLRNLVLLGAAGFGSMIVFAMLFEGLAPGMAAFRVLWRGTVGTGEVAWKVWDVYADGERFPYYWKTLFGALGGRASAVAGLGANPYLSYQFDYTELITLIAKNWAGDVTTETANVTGTVFAEGVIAFGSPGFLLMSVFAGMVAGTVRIALWVAVARRSALMAATIATYFATSVFSWLNAGWVAILIYFPFLVYYAVAVVAGWILLRVAGIPPDRPPVPRGEPELVVVAGGLA